MSSNLPLDDAARDALLAAVPFGDERDRLQALMDFGGGEYSGNVEFARFVAARVGRELLTFRARVAELEQRERRFYAADGSFVEMESAEAVVAARIEAAKRVAELGRQVAYEREQCAAAEAVAVERGTHANALRDALEKAVDLAERHYPDDARLKSSYAALAAHPAASLAAHRKRVLKEASGWVRSQDTAPHFTEQLRYTIAEGIDALAAQAQEVKRTEERWECPTCGLGVAADEDGCCSTCGADCKATQATVTIKARQLGKTMTTTRMMRSLLDQETPPEVKP